MELEDDSDKMTQFERRRAWQCDMGLAGSTIMMIYLLMIYVVQDKHQDSTSLI